MARSRQSQCVADEDYEEINFEKFKKNKKFSNLKPKKEIKKQRKHKDKWAERETEW